MRAQHSRRLADLERSSSDLLRSASGEPEIALLDAVLAGLRYDWLRYAGGQWIAKKPDYGYGEVASELNAMSADQPGAVVVALREAEFAEAIEALEAGRLRLSETNYMHYRWLNMDARTGTPRLDSASYQDADAARLATAVHSAVYHVHCQTGAPMPATLAEFGAWLRELRHLAICEAQP